MGLEWRKKKKGRHGRIVSDHHGHPLVSIENPNPLVVKPQLHVPEPTLLVIIEHTEHLELGLVGTIQQAIWCGLP
jgi:hypothetical protein